MAAVASGALVEASPTDEDPIIHSAEGVFAGWGDPAIEKGGVFTAVGVGPVGAEIVGQSKDTRPLTTLTTGIVMAFNASTRTSGSGTRCHGASCAPGRRGAQRRVDNAEANLVARVYDEIVPERSHSAQPVKFVVLDMLGQGTFGQVFHCQQIYTGDRSGELPQGSGDGGDSSGLGGDAATSGGGGSSSSKAPPFPSFRSEVGVKVVKNKPAYTAQAWVVRVAKLLNEEFDTDDSRHMVRLLDFFEYKTLCLVFELLSINLYEVLKVPFRGLPVAVVPPSRARCSWPSRPWPARGDPAT